MRRDVPNVASHEEIEKMLFEVAKPGIKEIDGDDADNCHYISYVCGYDFPHVIELSSRRDQPKFIGLCENSRLFPLSVFRAIKGYIDLAKEQGLEINYRVMALQLKKFDGKQWLPDKKYLNKNEVVTLVNERNEVTGSCRREEMRDKNLWHRATYVFVETGDGFLII